MESFMYSNKNTNEQTALIAALKESPSPVTSVQRSMPSRQKSYIVSVPNKYKKKYLISS